MIILKSETQAQRLKRLRHEKGWSQMQLSVFAGLRSKTTVSNVEKGKLNLLVVRNAESIAHSLGVTLDYLTCSTHYLASNSEDARARSEASTAKAVRTPDPNRGATYSHPQSEMAEVSFAFSRQKVKELTTTIGHLHKLAMSQMCTEVCAKEIFESIGELEKLVRSIERQIALS